MALGLSTACVTMLLKYFAQAIHKSWFPAKKLLSHTLLAQDEYEAAFSILNRAVREAPRSGMAEIGATDSALMGLWQERKLKDDYWAERYLRDALRYDREGLCDTPRPCRHGPLRSIP